MKLTRCRNCGTEPVLYEEGLARKYLNVDEDSDTHIVQFYCYAVECPVCGLDAYGRKTVEAVIEEWNAMMED